MRVSLEINKNLKDLLFGLVPEQLIPELNFNELVLDSRQLAKGDLFFAVQGSRAHGLDFLKSIEKLQPAIVLYEPTESYSNIAIDGVLCLPIEDLHKYVSLIAARYYGDPSKNLKITAITGTNGKTTCAYLLAQLLESQGLDVAVIGTTGFGRLKELQAGNLTTPDAISLQNILFQLYNSGVEHIVMEASSHALDQCRLEAVKVDVAAFTNLSHDHLDYHLNMEDYLRAKTKLFKFDSVLAAILNADEKVLNVIQAALTNSTQLITYAINSDQADLLARDHTVNSQGTQFELELSDKTLSFKSSLLGEFNVANVLLALAVMRAYNFEIDNLIGVVSKLKSPTGRLERLGGDKKPTVVVDYAHTPDALDKALMTLKKLSKKDLAVVFGCGGDRDKSKRAVMGAIAKQYSNRIYLTTDNPRSESPAEIIRDIKSGISKSGGVKVIPDRAEAIRMSIFESGLQDVVLIAGKGHENYQLIGHEKIDFSDQAYVQSALNVWQESRL